MAIYVIHYLFVLVIAFFSAFKKNLEKFFFVLLLIPFALLPALRTYRVDRDYHNYIDYFRRATSEEVNYFTLKVMAVCEPAMFFIPWIAKFVVGNHYIILSFIVFAVAGAFLKLKSAVLLSNSLFLSAILYLSNFFYLHEMTQVRAGVATGLLLLSIKYVYERRFWVFFLFVAGAFCFHYSSILFLGIYFLNPVKIKTRFYIGLIVLANILAIFKFDLLSLLDLSFLSVKVAIHMANKNQPGQDQINIFNYGFLINNVLTLLFLFKHKLIAEKNKYFLLMLKINTFSIISFVLLSGVPILAFRVSEVFGVVQYCLFPSMIYLFDRKWIGYTALTLFSALNFYNYIFDKQLFGAYRTWI